jgi:hypothetical protein
MTENLRFLMSYMSGSPAKVSLVCVRNWLTSLSEILYKVSQLVKKFPAFFEAEGPFPQGDCGLYSGG